MTLTAQQLAERKAYVGASEVAAALGLSRYCSRLELYLRKTTDVPNVESPAMRFGNLLESHVLDEFEKRRAPARLLRPVSPYPLRYEHGLLVCHLDALLPNPIDEESKVVEAKTSRNRDGWGEPGTDAIPQEYLLQTTTQMHLTGYRLAYVPVLFRDSLDLEVYEASYDPELAQMIVEGVAEFWAYVERGEPPAPDWNSPAALEIVRKVYPGTDGTILQADTNQEMWYRALCESQEREKSFSALADSAKAALLWDMQNAAELRFADGRMLRRKQVSKKGYTVEPSTYIDARFVNGREK